MKKGLKAEAVLCAGIFLFLLTVCNGPTENTPNATGVLTVSYQVNACLDSLVTVDGARAVWLEDNAGKYVATLVVTEWESTLGLSYTNRLTHWKAGVGGTSNTQIDAVTKATVDVGPNPGSNVCTTQVATLGIKPGTYSCCVECLITYNFNIMLKSPIKIGNVEDQATGATPVYTPSQHPTAGDIISNLQVKYTP